jgi:hypothetical protein
MIVQTGGRTAVLPYTSIYVLMLATASCLSIILAESSLVITGKSQELKSHEGRTRIAYDAFYRDGTAPSGTLDLQREGMVSSFN